MISDFTGFPLPGAPEDYSAGQTTWGYLAPHLEHGNLYFVDPAISLSDAAQAIARDEKQQVAAWLQSGDLVKLQEIHAAQWDPATTIFDAVVVSPFVLCRPIASK